MASSTVENYLKTLYLQQQRTTSKSRQVAMGRLAKAMDVTPGTATTMIKALSDSGMVDYKPRNGVSLTEQGEEIALHVLRRHRLVELFLVDILKLDWAEVHEEAEVLEHAISDKVLEKIDALLGHPSVDPHGDPIPNAKGKVKRTAFSNLADTQEGKGKARVARIIDQKQEFLRFLNRCGLTPGTDIVIEKHDEAADAVTVKVAGKSVTLGSAAAAKILVER